MSSDEGATRAVKNVLKRTRRSGLNIQGLDSGADSIMVKERKNWPLCAGLVGTLPPYVMRAGNRSVLPVDVSTEQQEGKLQRIKRVRGQKGKDFSVEVERHTCCGLFHPSILLLCTTNPCSVSLDL